MRQRYGTEITFRSAPWKVGCKKVGPSQAEAILPKDAEGFSYVGADAHCFVFGCMDFTPYTGAAAPTEAELITWHGQTYVITAVNFDDIEGDTNSINVFAIRRPS
jgi:hypothetical protein